MKNKMIYIAVSLILSFMLIACSQNASTPSDPPSSSEEDSPSVQPDTVERDGSIVLPDRIDIPYFFEGAYGSIEGKLAISNKFGYIIYVASGFEFSERGEGDFIESKPYEGGDMMFEMQINQIPNGKAVPNDEIGEEWCAYYRHVKAGNQMLEVKLGYQSMSEALDAGLIIMSAMIDTIRPATLPVMAIPVLEPIRIGSFLSKQASTSNGAAGAYEDNKNGSFYGYTDYFSEGDNQWDALIVNDSEGLSVSWSADSELAPQGSNSYSASNLGDFKKSTAWAEGVSGTGIGQKLTARVSGETRSYFGFSGFCIVNGYAKNQDVWKANARVKKMAVSYNGKPMAYLFLNDTDKPQYFEFEMLVPESVRAARDPKSNDDYPTLTDPARFEEVFSFEILEAYNGDKYEDACITGVAFDIKSYIY